MKKIIIYFCLFTSLLPLYSQTNHKDFIIEIEKFYGKNQNQFLKKSEKIMKKYAEEVGIINSGNKFEYIYIPELLLKKANSLYRIIDSTNVVQYFDPKSMCYNQTFVSKDSAFFGKIVTCFLGHTQKSEFNIKPPVQNYFSERIYDKLKEIDPEVVFTVQNINGYFYVKNRVLFVLYYNRGEDRIIDFTIEDYTHKYKEDIFFLFKFTPRVRTVVTH